LFEAAALSHAERRSTAGQSATHLYPAIADFESILGNPDEFSGLLEWCSEGRLVPPIDARYPLEQVFAAYSHLESGAPAR